MSCLVLANSCNNFFSLTTHTVHSFFVFCFSMYSQNRISTYDFPMFCENEKSIHPTTHTCVSHSKPNMSQVADGYGEHGAAVAPKTIRSDGADIQPESTSSGKTVIPLSKSTSLKTFSDRYTIPKNLFTASYKNLASHMQEDAPPFSAKVNKCSANAGCIATSNKNHSIDDSSRTSNDSHTMKASANDKDSKNTNAKKVAAMPVPALIPTAQPSSASPLISSRVQSAGVSAGNGRLRYKNNDSESSSGSDLIDLTTSASKKNVPVSDMYNDDIDYMNSYLKSLPDYNELNRKISNEQQKCEDIYDRLLCINSSLKSNLLPKSNSYHSICTASSKPYQSISARGENNNGSSGSSSATKNKIIRSSSSSIVNQNLINNPDKFGANPIAEPKQSIAKIKTGPNQTTANTKMVAKAPQQQPQQQQQHTDTNKDFNEMYKLRNPLPKSASSTSLHRSNSIKELNDFWSENLARSNQQKLGWNYSRIMASRGDNANADANPNPNPNGNANMSMGTNASSNNNNRPNTKLITNKSDNYTPLSGYKLQKNMSLSQLDQRIRQNVSREELYNLICNNEPVQQQQQQQQKPAESTKHLSHMSGNKNNITYNNNLHRSAADTNISSKSKPNQTAHHMHSKPQNVHQPMQCTSSASGPTNTLSKSFSQQSMPSFFTHFTKMKSPKKNSIPTLFKPLCKSTSNTHVFNNQATRDAPQETFTPKFLMKSSSSSSIFNSNGLLQKIYPLNKFNSSFNNAKNVNNSSSGHVPPTSIAPATFNNHQHHHHHHHHNSKISKNNELLKTQNKNLLHEMTTAASKTGTMSTPTPAATLPQSAANKQNTDNFYVKQNFPEFCKATVSYTSTKSNLHMPTYGNLPSIPPLSNPAPSPSATTNKPNTNSR